MYLRQARVRHPAASWRVLACTGLLLSGCASPGGKVSLSPLASTAEVTQTRRLLAVTTRTPASDEGKGELFSAGRGDGLHYVSLNLSMPPDRPAGAVPTQAENPDPRKHIALIAAENLDQRNFGSLLKSAPFAKRRVLIFIHGFNTSFDEAVVRLAQIVEDTHFQGVPILFSWPSGGEVTDYGYDKDSANFSRDGLEKLLIAIAREPNVEGIDIFAHSMGNWLTLETLRQLAIANDQRTLKRLGTIVLAEPDVDMDVFTTQLARLGTLKSHISLYASKDDRALELSRRLFGGKIRAGENTDLEQFRRLGITAHDLSDVAGGIGRNHDKAFGDETTLAEIGRLIGKGTPAYASGPDASTAPRSAASQSARALEPGTAEAKP